MILLNNLPPPPYNADSKRVKWIDAAKSLGIVLVFWGHILYGGSNIGGYINQLIYSFHMPMYFILSGIVAKDENLPFGQYVCNKFKRVLLPALCFYLMTLPIYFLQVFNNRKTLDFESCVYDIFYIKGHCAYNDPIWFFICLFEVLCFGKLIHLTKLTKRSQMWVCVCSFTIAILLSVLNLRYSALFGLNCVILALGFYTFGICLRRYQDMNPNYCEKKLSAYIIILIVLWLLVGLILNPKVSMYGFMYGNRLIPLFILSGIMGSIVFFRLAYKLRDLKILNFFAKYTTIIICSHYLFVSSFNFLSTRFGLKGTIFFDILSLLYVIVVLWVLYRPLCVAIDKYLPFLNGKR